MKIKDIKSDINDVFKLPIKKFYFGLNRYGTPYYGPWNYNPTILTIRKHRPQFLRCNWFKMLGYEINYGWPIMIVNYELGYKDKFNSPRFEWSPCFQIHFFGLQFCRWYISPVNDEDGYWEQVLWYLHYSDKDIEKAEKTWGWVDFTTKKSTWKKEFLINN